MKKEKKKIKGKDCAKEGPSDHCRIRENDSLPSVFHVFILYFLCVKVQKLYKTYF